MGNTYYLISKGKELYDIEQELLKEPAIRKLAEDVESALTVAAFGDVDVVEYITQVQKDFMQEYGFYDNAYDILRPSGSTTVDVYSNFMTILEDYDSIEDIKEYCGNLLIDLTNTTGGLVISGMPIEFDETKSEWLGR